MIWHGDPVCAAEQRYWLPMQIFRLQVILLSKSYWDREYSWSRLQCLVRWWSECLPYMVRVEEAYSPQGCASNRPTLSFQFVLCGSLYWDLGRTCPWRYRVCPSTQLLSPFESQQRYTGLKPTNQSPVHPNEDEWTLTFPAFKPSPNEVDHFFHDLGKLSHGAAQSIWDSNFLESVELVSKHLDAVCKTFHGFIGFLLSLQMLPKLSVVLSIWERKRSQLDK